MTLPILKILCLRNIFRVYVTTPHTTVWLFFNYLTLFGKITCLGKLSARGKLFFPIFFQFFPYPYPHFFQFFFKIFLSSIYWGVCTCPLFLTFCSLFSSLSSCFLLYFSLVLFLLASTWYWLVTSLVLKDCEWFAIMSII